MLNDPSVEFRRDAVTRLIDEAAGLEGAQRPIDAGRVYLKALQGARDQDQTEAVVKALEKLGHHVDLPEHFGFVMDWKLIGPFDSTANKGFTRLCIPRKRESIWWPNIPVRKAKWLGLLTPRTRNMESSIWPRHGGTPQRGRHATHTPNSRAMRTARSICGWGPPIPGRCVGQRKADFPGGKSTIATECRLTNIK